MMNTILQPICHPQASVYSSPLLVFNEIILIGFNGNCIFFSWDSEYFIFLGYYSFIWCLCANIFFHSVECLHFSLCFFCLGKPFKFDVISFVCYYFCYLSNGIKSLKTPLRLTCFSEYPEEFFSVFLNVLYGFWSHFEIFNSFWINFCEYCEM